GAGALSNCRAAGVPDLRARARPTSLGPAPAEAGRRIRSLPIVRARPAFALVRAGAACRIRISPAWRVRVAFAQASAAAACRTPALPIIQTLEPFARAPVAAACAP